MKKRKTNNSKKIDKQCRNHDSCSYCKGNRLHANKKRELETKKQVKEYLYGN